MRKSIKIVENVLKLVNSRIRMLSSRIRGIVNLMNYSEFSGDYNKIHYNSSSTKLPRCVAFNFFNFPRLIARTLGVKTHFIISENIPP